MPTSDEPKLSRACVALINNNNVLMVEHVHDGETYWTLPGGKIEQGESPAQAAIRELQEETGIIGEVTCKLFEDGHECCFLVRQIVPGEAKLGYDPEVDRERQIIARVGWLPIQQMVNDVQISRVLMALSKIG
jgi:8-oxo-dGTP diphosphatase